LTEPVGLGTLFVSSFLAATLLPGGSEVVFSALLLSGTIEAGPAIAVATLGNSLGGLSSYLLGRLLPDRATDARAVKWLRLWGSPTLLLSWAPFFGDALCVAAGWLRVRPIQAALFITIGKFVRYWVLAELLM
jgi:membrane protein YqaA with SNARE-associated domain